MPRSPRSRSSAIARREVATPERRGDDPTTDQTTDPTTSAPRHFARALDALVAQLRDDRAITAAILCGSLAHDTVWARSDIDLVLVTIDDKLVDGGSVSLDAEGVTVHASLIPRARFKRIADGAMTHSFMHSLLAKGRLLFSHDESLPPLLERMRVLGERDTQLLMLEAATEALACLYKARKWLLTRGDLDYTALWILAAATPLARIEVMSRGLLADREVLPTALGLNPTVFSAIYPAMLNAPKTRAIVEGALALADGYLRERSPAFSAPVVAWLEEAGDARSCTELDAHFRRTHGVEHVSGACEYLADQGIIARASVTTRLTKRSTADVQELAFYALTPPPDVC